MTLADAFYLVAAIVAAIPAVRGDLCAAAVGLLSVAHLVA